jgi:cephalosporin-C deacetylase
MIVRRPSSLFTLLVTSCLLTLTARAEERAGQIQVRVTTDHADWSYSLGQPVAFHIAAIMDGHPVEGIEVEYEIGPEMMPPLIKASAKLPAAGIDIPGGTLKQPGFLRCVAVVKRNNRTYQGLATAGFEPQSIQPTAEDPADFDQYWEEAKAALAKVPIDAQLTPLPSYGSGTVDCFQLDLQTLANNGRTSRFFGILCEPKLPGKYPALLNVPGAGVRPYRGMVAMAEKGIITLQVGIHGIPVTMDPSVYDVLRRGALSDYATYGLDNRDRYYYKRVYLGCIRANDFLVSHPKWDGHNLGVTGGSQGGALSIVVAGLDRRVTVLAAYYPALSDLTGYLSGRAGGWPHMFRAAGEGSHRTPDQIRTSAYYDVVNFARRVKAPGLYLWGWNDEVCPPTSTYSAYNVIQAEKRLILALETGHWSIPEENGKSDQWLVEHLTGRKE